VYRIRVTTDAEPLTAAFELGPAPADARGQVLVLHGFTGSPWEVRPFGEALAARGYRVVAPRLPGHGSLPEAMLWVTWRDWLDAAERALAPLAHREPVVVAGLSMGSLLALLLAARHPKAVRGLVLMAPVLRLKPLHGRVLKRLHTLLLGVAKDAWVTKETTDIADEEVRRRAPIMRRYPLPRLFDMFVLQDLAMNELPLVRAPALVAGAVHDAVVPFEAAEELHRALPSARLLRLERGAHILPRDFDRARLFTEVAAFIEGLSR